MHHTYASNWFRQMALVALFSLSFGAALFAYALPARAEREGGRAGVSVTGEAKVEIGDGKDEADADVEGDANDEGDHDGDRASATSSKMEDEDSSESADGDNEKDEAEEHESAVADFVHKLLETADRHQGIGKEVREVAKEQEMLASSTAKAINEVHNRSAFINFLVGANLKNLGELRSSLVTTENHIDRLVRIASSTSGQVQAELSVEIASLTAERDRLRNLVTDNEDRFSLFGWAVRLFQ